MPCYFVLIGQLSYTSFLFAQVLTTVRSSTLEFIEPQIVDNQLLSNKNICRRDNFWSIRE